MNGRPSPSAAQGEHQCLNNPTSDTGDDLPEPTLLFLTTLNGYQLLVTTTAIRRVEATTRGCRLHLRHVALDVIESFDELTRSLQPDVR